MNRNLLKAAYHAGAIDAGIDVMQEDHYDRLLRDLRAKQEAERLQFEESEQEPCNES
jgi:hypothetical protein